MFQIDETNKMLDPMAVQGLYIKPLMTGSLHSWVFALLLFIPVIPALLSHTYKEVNTSMTMTVSMVPT